MKKSLIILLASVILVFGFLFYTTFSSSTETSIAPAPSVAKAKDTLNELKESSTAAPTAKKEQEIIIKKLQASSTASVPTKNQQLDLLKALEAGSKH